MLKGKILTAKNFLKSPSEREKYQCWICYQICIKPVQCKGPCGHIFCMKCVSDTRNNNQDRCPSRCSSPFLVSPLPQLKLEFYCPYNPTHCTLEISSMMAFQNHFKICPYVSAQELNHKTLQLQYKCLHNHFLQFFIGSYQQMIKAQCHECGQQKICRSFCRICQTFYCVSCRVPPCSKQGCPIGHKFTFQRIAALNYLCDICGISTAVSNGGVYDDSECNFGICELCYKELELPEKYDESKPRAIVKNINTQCSCGQTLMLQNSIMRKHKCQLCKKQRQCPKHCLNCNKYYCLSCKSFDVFSDLTCLSDHTLQRHLLSSSHPNLVYQSQLGCMRCSSTSQTYFYDDQCHIRLCEACFVYSMKVTTDKERPVELTCRHNHVLSYIQDENEENEFQGVCCICQKNKIIRLACTICDEDQSLYCFQCRSIPLRTCYFNHKLKFAQTEMDIGCQLCMKQVKSLFYCKKCSFAACKGCVEMSLNGEKMEIEMPEQMKMEEKTK